MSGLGKSNDGDLNFKEYYLMKYFEEHRDDSSPLELCSAARNSMIRIFAEASKNLSNGASCFLLKQHLNEYNQLMHRNASVVDEMSKQINNLLGDTKRNTQCSKDMESSKIDYKKILKDDLKQMNHCNVDNDHPCDKEKITQSGLKWLGKQKDLPKVDDVIKLLTSNEGNSSTDKIKKTIPPQTFKNVQLFNTDKLERQTRFDDTKKPTFETVRPKEMINPKDTIYLNENRQSVEDRKPQLGNAFKTAREELKIQNIKKYGNANQNVARPPINNGNGKKNLGTTRTVTSKFVSPFSKEEEPPETETVQDERLKHIDPKMVELIMSEIVDTSASIGWDDIAGLQFAKNVIQEAVVWPLLRPDIFTGLRRPPKGILLFGPPGTGKTLIGKCIASQCNATFFSISASSLTSKWIGDGEKMVRALFAVARSLQPSVVFIDEIDSLLTQRSNEEHESSRRIKTEFLVQLDGASIGDDDRILLIGATNRPQELDEAARRRLVKRLYIPLPDTDARKQIIVRLMSKEKHSLSCSDIDDIAVSADGFSGADMRSLCAEAALGPIRSVSLSQINDITCEQVRPVSKDDFNKALTRVRPSVSKDDLDGYIKWDGTYGSGSAF